MIVYNSLLQSTSSSRLYLELCMVLGMVWLQSNISQQLGTGNQASHLIEIVKGMPGDVELCEPASTDSPQSAF